MTQPTARPANDKLLRAVVLIWALGATVTTLIFAASTLYLYMGRPRPGASAGGSAAATVLPDASPAAPLPTAISNPDPGGRDLAVIVLGEQEAGAGLKHLADCGDGRTVIRQVGGVSCRFLTRNHTGLGYFYFEIDPSFKNPPIRAAVVEIEYLDLAPGMLRLQYDSMKAEQHHAYEYATPIVRMAGSGQWQKVVFQLQNTAFVNSQNSGADFRLDVSPPELHVRRVALTRADPGR